MMLLMYGRFAYILQNVIFLIEISTIEFSYYYQYIKNNKLIKIFLKKSIICFNHFIGQKSGDINFQQATAFTLERQVIILRERSLVLLISLF